MEKGNQKRRGRRRRWKFTSGLLAGMLAFALMLGLVPGGTGNVYAADETETRISDSLTLNNWPEASNNNEELDSIGRIWTDKSVNTETVNLNEKSGLSVSKDENADFLVGLSALSSTSNLTTTVDKPLDIVLVLDKSGSMGDRLNSYEKTYNVNSNSRNNYYVLINGEYKEVSYSDGGRGQQRGWYYTTGRNRYYVTPMTSADDTNPGHVQFYVRDDGTTKLEALQAAVNAFIDQTAEQNQGKEQASQHRIAIVSYAYGKNSYEWNKAEINNDFTYVTTEGKWTLQQTVNGLYADGSTYADDGMSLAKDVMDGTGRLEGAREDAQKIVIFFTDGEPNHSNGFSGSVAASAINTAYDLKADDTLIYTIGVFEKADPSQDPNDYWTENFNKYMHAVSSNYPEATAEGFLGGDSWNGLEFGTPNEKSGYYKAASDSASLNQVFEEISEDLQTPGSSPTAVSGDAARSGYITFTDKLGDYMEVTGETVTVVYAGVSYTGKIQGDGSVQFENTDLPGNGIYTGARLSDVRVSIQKGSGTAGDTITVRIPAALIPLNQYTVKNDEITEVTNASPIRVFYNVKLSDTAEDALKDPESDLVQNAQGGPVSFYSNAWSHGSETTAEFKPNEKNAYYSQSGTDSLDKVNNATGTAGTVYDSNWTAGQDVTYQLGNNGKLTVPITAGALQVTKKTTAGQGLTAPDKEFAFELTLTDSSDTALTGTFDAVKKDREGNRIGDVFEIKNGGTFTLKSDESIYIYGLPDGTKYSVTETSQGNGFKVVGAGSVSGSVTAGQIKSESFTNHYSASGISADLKGTKTIKNRPFQTGDSFTFKVEGEYEGTAGEVTAPMPANTSEGMITIKPTSGAETEIDFGRITFTVPGTYIYTISEQDVASTISGVAKDGTVYTVTYEVTDAENGTLKVSDPVYAVKGAEPGAEKPDALTWENTYTASSVTIGEDTENGIQVQKTLTGRDWIASDSFTFELEAETPGAPMPDSETVVIKDAAGTEEGTAVSAWFGNITYTKTDLGGAMEKTFTYTVTEVGTGGSGLTFDKHTAKVTVTVKDNGKGSLTASVAYDNSDAITENDKAVTSAAAFTNTYASEPITLTGDTALKVQKTVTGAPNSEDFSFTAVLDTEKSSENAAAHVDELNQDGKITAEITDDFNAGDMKTVSFGNLTFNAAGTYVFTVKEDNTTDKDGWTYDRYEHTVTIEVTDNTSAGKLEAKVTVDGKEGNTVSFTNSYQTGSGTVEVAALKGSKTLTGRNSLENEKFTFTLAPTPETRQKITEGDLLVPGTLTAEVGELTDNVKQNFNFSGANITINEAGTYTFEVKETIPAEADSNHVYKGVTYDAHTGVITITATDNDFDGRFEIEVTYGTDNGKEDTPDFVNKYQAGGTVTPGTGEAEAKLTKVLKNREWGENETFSFTITADDKAWENTLPEERTVTVSKPETGNEAAFNFGSFTFSEEGTYTYTVKETVPEDTKGVAYDTHEAKVTIVVTDDLQGGYAASVSIEDAVFTNTYGTELNYQTAGGLSIQKTMENRAIAQDEFQFVIAPQDEASASLLGIEVGTKKTVKTPEESLDMEPGTAVVSIPVFDGNVSFDQEDDGQTYTYIISEAAGDKDYYTYDNSEYQVVIKVSDDKAGTLTAVTTVSVKNPETSEYEKVKTYTYSSKGGSYEIAVVPFTNSYNAETVIGGGEGNVSIQAVKTLKNKDLEADAFKFDITYADGTPVANADGTPVTGTNAADGTITFGTIEYDMAKLLADVKTQKAVAGTDSDGKDTYTYIYKVSEDTSSLPEGISAEVGSLTVKVVVTDNGDGTLTPEVIYPEGSDGKLEFVNTYGSTASASVEVGGTKVLQTEPDTTPPDITGKYTFTIEGSPAEDGTPAPMPESTTAVNNVTGAVSFGAIEFTMENVFGKVEEPLNPDETKDVDQAEPTEPENGETVDDPSEEGKEEISEIVPPAVENEQKPAEEPSVNTDDNTDTELPAADETVDADVPETSASEGTGEDAELSDDNSVKDTTEGNKEAIELPENDVEAEKEAAVSALDMELLQTAPGQEDGSQRSKTFTYTVTESGTVAGVKNDENSYSFTVTVTDNDDGTITAVCSKDAGDQFVFTNTYSVDPATDTPTGDDNGLTITKKVTGRALVDKEFDFELVDQRTNEVVVKGTNDANGNVELSGITFEKPGTYSYILREKAGTAGGVSYDTASYKVKAEVTDDGDGTMSVAWKYGENEAAELEAVFQNTYTAAPTSVTLGAVKRLDGRTLAAGEFTFRLTDESGKVVSEAKNDANGAISFSALTFDKAGTYKYTVTEVKGTAANVTYDGAVYNVTIHVADNNNGQLTAQVDNGGKSLVFTNTYTEPAKPDNDNDGGSSSGGSGSSSPSQVQVSSAQTGDDTNILLPLIGICVSGAVLGICAVVIYNRKKKTE